MCLIVHKSELPQLLTEDKIVYKIVEFDTDYPHNVLCKIL